MTELICIVCPNGCHLRVDEKNGLETFNKLEICFRNPHELMNIALAEAENQFD